VQNRPEAAVRVQQAPIVTVASVKGLSRTNYDSQNQCAILTDGQVLCWGANWANELSSTSGIVSVPVTLTGVSDAVEISGSDSRICVLHENETVSCVGENRGAFGDGTDTDSTTLVTVTEYLGGPPMGGIKDFDTNYEFSCAVMSNGTVRCWGSAIESLGAGYTTTSFVPVTVTGITSAVQVALTVDAGCAALESGNVQCWGYKENLGIGATENYSVPVTVLASAGGAPLDGIVEMSSGSYNVCGRTAAGEQYCWGSYGSAGNGTPAADIAYPTRAQRIEDQTDLSGVEQIVGADADMCARLTDGTVRCWGSNALGQVGVGNRDAYTRAVTVTLGTGNALTDVVELGNSSDQYCARTSTGNVYCWGQGKFGEIGNGLITDSLRATLVIALQAPAVPDASLVDLTIAPGTLAPAFVSSTTSYTAEVPNGTTSLAVTATTTDVGATVAYSSSAGACTAGTCTVAAPKTWITATVTAADGTTTQKYSIEITVADANASNDAALGDLTINPGTLSPAFVSSTTSYAANAPNGTTSMAVTATVNDAGATVSYASSAGDCTVTDSRSLAAAPANCAVTAPKTWITVTVTAEDGTTPQKYSIEITVADASLTTIDRVWPGTGLPEGGMPVQIFGTGFVAPLTVTVGPYDGVMIAVPFTIENDGQIDFVMPPGLAGQQVSVTVQTANDTQTAANAFTYVEPDVIEFDGETGGVFTTTDGVVVTIPPQGVAGSFVITMTPLPPAPGVPGNILMYSFRLDALLNGFKLETLTNPVTITLPIDEGIFAIADGERPWLYSWTADGRPQTAVGTTVDGGQRLVVGGRWILVRGQEYNPGTRLMTVALRPMGVYALSTAYIRAYWLPLVPVVK
jgi:alpha-tubulin suppressor-like RCC1 family protein